MARAASSALAGRVRGRGSSSFATCIVSVDAPETTCPRARPLHRRAQDGAGVDARLGIEKPVFDRDQKLREEGRDLRALRLEPPDAARRWGEGDERA